MTQLCNGRRIWQEGILNIVKRICNAHFTACSKSAEVHKIDYLKLIKKFKLGASVFFKVGIQDFLKTFQTTLDMGDHLSLM